MNTIKEQQLDPVYPTDNPMKRKVDASTLKFGPDSRDWPFSFVCEGLSESPFMKTKTIVNDNFDVLHVEYRNIQQQTIIVFND